MVRFTEKILNEKLHFLCAVIVHKQSLIHFENPETSQERPEAFLSTFFSIPNPMFCQ